MPRNSRTAVVQQRRREAGRAGDRFVDLDLSIVDDGSGELLLRVGGCWDRRKKSWRDGDAATTRAIRVHKGQLPAARWLCGWFDDHLSGADKQKPFDERIFSAMLGGGQRSGKTWLGVPFAVAYAVAIPHSIVWIVSPAERDHEEIQNYLRATMPRNWYSELGAPWYRYTLPNGSKIVLRTAHEPDKLKKGDADLIVLNEAQQVKERAFAICRGRIAAAGGLVIVVANPPEEEIGQWVGDFAVEAEEGQRQATFFHLDPLDNPHIDHAPLLAMAKEFDEHTFDVEVRGLFLGERNAALHNWSRLHNEKGPPDDRPDITREVLRHLEGREYDRAVGVDIQRYPHMASCTFQFYENPLATSGIARLEWPHMHATSSLILKAADEDELARAWLEAGYDPERTLIVCDASGEWQFAERDPLKVQELRNKVQGRGSFDVFRMHGFRHIVKPDRDMEKNPDVNERFRATTSRISTKIIGPYGQRYLFSDPRNKELNKAIRQLPFKNGKPVRYSKYAHACDAFTYPVQRFFPRRIKEKAPEIKLMGRYDRKRQMAAY